MRVPAAARPKPAFEAARVDRIRGSNSISRQACRHSGPRRNGATVLDRLRVAGTLSLTGRSGVGIEPSFMRNRPHYATGYTLGETGLRISSTAHCAAHQKDVVRIVCGYPSSSNLSLPIKQAWGPNTGLLRCPLRRGDLHFRASRFSNPSVAILPKNVPVTRNPGIKLKCFLRCAMQCGRSIMKRRTARQLVSQLSDLKHRARCSALRASANSMTMVQNPDEENSQATVRPEAMQDGVQPGLGRSGT